ncbi:hypothetical protein JW978_01480 [Candidatus Dojkabacteria bacterium]|nr:hypothetical protein [Candidatus Dojkabacteria bacterium]
MATQEQEHSTPDLSNLYTLRDMALDIQYAIDPMVKDSWNGTGIEESEQLDLLPIIATARETLYELAGNDIVHKVPEVEFVNTRGLESVFRETGQALVIPISEVHLYRGTVIHDTDDIPTRIIVNTVLSSPNVLTGRLDGVRPMTREEATFVSMHESSHAVCQTKIIKTESPDITIKQHGFSEMRITRKNNEAEEEIVDTQEHHSLFNEWMTDFFAAYSIDPEVTSFEQLASKVLDIRKDSYMARPSARPFKAFAKLLDALATFDPETRDFQEVIGKIFKFYRHSDREGFLAHLRSLCANAGLSGYYYSAQFSNSHNISYLLDYFETKQMTGVENYAKLIGYHLVGDGDAAERQRKGLAPEEFWAE